MLISKRARPIGSTLIAIEATDLIPVVVRHNTVEGLPVLSRATTLPPPDEITPQWASAQLSNLTDPEYPENRLFYDGDHWQGGAGWTGQMPPRGDPDYRRVFDMVKESFVSTNCVKEVSDRKTDAAVGREPGWFITVNRATGQTEPPSQDEQALIREAETLLTEWWNAKQIHALVQRACLTAFLAGRAPIRIFVPRGLLDTFGNLDLPPDDTAMQAALDAIFVHDPEPQDAGVIIDNATMRPIGLFVAQDTEGRTVGEIIETQPRTQQNLDGTVTRLRDMDTVVRVLEPSTTQPNTLVESSVVLNLQGRLLINEVTLPKLVTTQVKRQQKAINKALTMMDHNADLAGFLERTILNGQMPGHFEQRQRPDGTTQPVYIRDEYQAGGGSVNYINGWPIRNQKGEVVGVTNPSIVYRGPESPSTFVDTYMAYYACVLRETQQLHYLTAAGSQYASGDARIQARSEFEDALKKVKTAFDFTIAWILETALLLAAHFAGRTEEFSTLRAIVDTHINPGPVTSERVRTAIELRTAGGSSRQRMMLEAGIDDTDAEARVIAAENEAGVPMPTAGSGRTGEGVGVVTTDQAQNG